MIAVVVGVGFDRVAHGLARNPFQSGILHPYLDVSHILVGERARLAHIADKGFADLVQQHCRTCHLVIGERVAHGRIAAQCDQGICDDRQRFWIFALAEDALV